MPTLAPPSRSGQAAGRPAETALGLSRTHAVLLAYSAGWVTGLLVLWLEARDRETRVHAAQAVLGFGGLALIGVVLLGVAGIGLLSSLALFRAGVWAAQALVLVGFGFWAWAMATVALGGSPRWPLVAARAERLAGSAPSLDPLEGGQP